MPAWLDDDRRYYSEIGEPSASPVNVFDVADIDEVTSSSPGKLCLRLEPRSHRSPRVKVFDGDGREEAIIRPEGPVPWVRYAMRREDHLVWSLSVRSVVRKRHALQTANGAAWAIETPFFWWQHLTGATAGAPRLLGAVGPTARYWLMSIEPGWDTFDLLAAAAFLHRQWWRF